MGISCLTMFNFRLFDNILFNLAKIPSIFYFFKRDRFILLESFSFFIFGLVYHLFVFFEIYKIDFIEFKYRAFILYLLSNYFFYRFFIINVNENSIQIVIPFKLLFRSLSFNYISLTLIYLLNNGYFDERYFYNPISLIFFTCLNLLNSLSCRYLKYF